MNRLHRPNRLGWILVAALAVTGACDEGSKESAADSGKTATKDGPAKKPAAADKEKMLAEATPAKTAEALDDEFAGFDPRVVKAAKVAKDIEADPAKADEALEERGLDREALDSLMFEIARDPDLTGQYRIARGL